MGEEVGIYYDVRGCFEIFDYPIFILTDGIFKISFPIFGSNVVTPSNLLLKTSLLALWVSDSNFVKSGKYYSYFLNDNGY